MNLDKNNNSSFREYEITVHELKVWLDQKKTFTLLDVREAWELEKAAFKHYQHICLDALEESLDDIDRTYPIVVVCHHGRRSLAACYYLREKGFVDTVSLKGGIHLWAQKMDPLIDQY